MGLDGHDRGVKVIARALRDSGVHVIYSGLWQTPKSLAISARDEDCDGRPAAPLAARAACTTGKCADPTAVDTVRGLIAAMAGTGAHAKIRTGGVTPEAFPQATSVARFIHACAMADVGFKATAGLHHPVRGEFNLTYEPACPRGVMYGFLNVFMAAALAMSARLGVEELDPQR